MGRFMTQSCFVSRCGKSLQNKKAYKNKTQNKQRFEKTSCGAAVSTSNWIGYILLVSFAKGGKINYKKHVCEAHLKQVPFG